MHYSYLVVEGPHDVEFVGAMLKPHEFHHVRLLNDLDGLWAPLVPRTFPHNEDLLRRVPVPTFFTSPTHSLAVDSAIGDTALVKTFHQTFAVLPDLADRLTSTAILLDADNDKRVPLPKRFETIQAGIRTTGLDVPDQPGHVTTGGPRCGIFIFPDNSTPGTLEDLLLDAAVLSYPPLLASATQHVTSMNNDRRWAHGSDLKELIKPAGFRKATVAAMASLLKPGKAIQTSIQDNHWLDAGARQLPRIRSFADFLATLLGLPP